LKNAITSLGAGLSLVLLSGCTAMEDAGSLAPVSCSSVAKALSEARPGETVVIDECTAEGTLVVPPEVRLQGSGPGRSFIVARAGQPAVVLTPGASADTEVSGVTITSEGTAAIQALGEGRVRVSDVDVEAARGVGIGLEDITSAHLDRVTLSGPIRDPSGVIPPQGATPDQTATHGVVAVDVREISLSNVNADGFAGYGALLVRSEATWSGGGTSMNQGVGVMVVGGTAALTDLELCGTLRGENAFPASGGVFVSEETVTEDPAQQTAGAAVTLTNVTACDNEGAGVIYADGNPEAGGTSLMVEGLTATANRFTGLLVADSTDISVRSSEISETILETWTNTSSPEVQAGDGVQLLRSTRSTFDQVTISANRRGGLLVDIGETPIEQAGLSWNEVAVNAHPDFGAVCQGVVNGTATAWGADAPVMYTWDAGIVRDTEAEASDVTAMLSPLVVVGIIDPNFRPDPRSVVLEGLVSINVR
jgi:hypothetical protein